ncbi:MAG: NAD(P)H-quinone oxidoreductase [Gemmatimonadota bacterium]|nr:MAG: NAD(P)H-quinone oxidoreductase [Gemmatimonadota bacterium]
MNAVLITAAGGPEVLQLHQVTIREPGRGEMRVRVRAAGVNRADLLQRRGLYPPPPGWPAEIPGLEYAGEVESVGDGVALWQAGDCVMGLVGGGGYAEFVVVPEREAIAVPAGLSFEEAAAIPEVFITAHDALFTQLGLGLGERLLIHAVGSGVGTAALQLAKVAGATVLGTSRSAWKLERARELGLDVAIDSSKEDMAEAVRGATGGEGVHAILDLVGGPYLAGSLESLAVKGRMIVVGLTAGRNAEVDLGAVLSKRLHIVGTSLRTRPLEERIAAARAFDRDVGGLLSNGRVRPILDRVLPLEEAAEAHRQMESNANFGKIVLKLPTK